MSMKSRKGIQKSRVSRTFRTTGECLNRLASSILLDDVYYIFKRCHQSPIVNLLATNLSPLLCSNNNYQGQKRHNEAEKFKADNAALEFNRQKDIIPIDKSPIRGAKVFFPHRSPNSDPMANNRRQKEKAPGHRESLPFTM